MVTLIALPLFVPPADCDGQQTPPQGKTIEIKIEKKKYVPPGRTPKIPDEFRNSGVRFVVRPGDNIKICNNDRFFAKPMSLSDGNKFEGLAGPGGLRPGDCITYVAKNDTGKTIRFYLADEIHARTKLFMVVLPANAPDQGEEDTPVAPFHAPTEYPLTEGGEIIDAQDEAEIEVTVLGKSSTDEKSKPAPIKGASVKAGGIIAETYGDGVATLTAEFAESQEVTVQANGYKTKTQKVQVNKPTATSAGSGTATFILEPELSVNSPQLGKNWSDLLAAINDLEPRLMAWNNMLTETNQVLQGIAKLQDEIAKINQRATKDSDQVDQLRKAFSGVNGKSAAQMRCEEAARLKKNIEDYSKEATDKEKELRETIDQAKGMSATCSKVWEAEAIGKLYEQAIRVTAAIGVLEKKAVKDGNALKDLAKERDELKDTTGEVENKLADLVLDATQADKLAADAGKAILRAREMTKITKWDYPAVRAELAKLKKTFALDLPPADVPKELLKRVATMDEIVSKKSGDAFSAPGLDSVEGIQQVANEVKRKRDDAQKRMDEFKADKKSNCTIDSMDDAVDAIGAIVTGATFELGAAADLPAMANACVAKANAEKDEVTVPDVSRGGDDAAALLAGAAPFTGTLVATNNPPPAGTTKLFSNQLPLAGTKANPKTTQIQIFLHQSVAEAAKSPPPPPSPDADEITVPDVSKFKDPDAMLAAAGPDMIGMIIATNKTPPKGWTKLFAHQDPLAGTKSKRGKTLTIFVYQSLADASPSPTEASTVTAPPTAVAKATPQEASPSPLADNTSPSPVGDNNSPSPVADNASPSPGPGNTGTGSGDWVGTWGATGPNGIKISRSGSGYILVGSITDGKPVPGKEQGGSLVFSWDLDLRDVVGILGQAEKIGKKEDSSIGAKYIFTHNSDKLDMVMETTQPGGKVKRDPFNAIPRVGN
jgi:hypothetical protein